MPICPGCKEEFREGFAVCADCGEALVEKLCEADRPQTEESTKERTVLVDTVALRSIADNVCAGIKKRKAAVLAAAAVLLILASGLLFMSNRFNQEHITPLLFANAEDGSQAMFNPFRWYNWNFGSMFRPDIRSEGQMSAYELMNLFQSAENWEEIQQIDHPDFAPLMITVGQQDILTLSTRRDELENNYKEVLAYVIWRPDGTVYDSGQREPYGTLLPRVARDSDGFTTIIAPYEPGEYVYDITLLFARGTIQFALIVIVEHE